MSFKDRIKRFLPLSTLVILGMTYTTTHAASAGDAAKQLHSDYMHIVRNEGASLSQLAEYWDLSTLRELYNVEDGSSLEVFEYALEYPEVFESSPDSSTSEKVGDTRRCLLSVGKTADGEGHVAVHILFVKRNGSWLHNQVHIQFLTKGHQVPEEPGCQFAEGTPAG